MKVGRRTLAIGGAAVALVMGVATPALAEGNGVKVGPADQMRFDSPGTSSIGWQSVGATQDSPFDANGRALVMHLDAAGFVDAFTRKSLAINTPVQRFKNLSFDFNNTLNFGGGLRFSVGFTTNSSTFLFAAPDSCNNPIPVSVS